MEQTLLPKQKPKRKKRWYVLLATAVAIGAVYVAPIPDDVKGKITRVLLGILTGGF